MTIALSNLTSLHKTTGLRLERLQKSIMRSELRPRSRRVRFLLSSESPAVINAGRVVEF